MSVLSFLAFSIFPADSNDILHDSVVLKLIKSGPNRLEEPMWGAPGWTDFYSIVP